MSEFDKAIRIGDAGAGWYAGMLSYDWKIGEAVNGGLLMALAATAAADASRDVGGHGGTLSFSAVFLSPGTAGPVRIEPMILRTGRSMSSAQVVVTQPVDDAPVDGTQVERFRALLTLGDLDRHAGAALRTTPAPTMPAPEECVSTADAPLGMSNSGFMQRLDMRLDPATVGWAVGTPSGQGEMRGWLRFADQREPDALSLLLALDAFPPVVFDLGSTGWAPTPITWPVDCSTRTARSGTAPEHSSHSPASSVLHASPRHREKRTPRVLDLFRRCGNGRAR